jgi:hypothetical protein
MVLSLILIKNVLPKMKILMKLNMLVIHEHVGRHEIQSIYYYMKGPTWNVLKIF